MAADCVRHKKIDVITLVPPYMEQMGRDLDLLEVLSHKVETVMWAGGDVSLEAGNAISSKFKLFTAGGSTEMGFYPILRRSGPWLSDQWKFLRFHPAMNMKLQHRSDDLFEGQIQRNSSSGYEQPIFKVFPSLQEYNTGDLFSPHPLDADLWQYRGRADDMQIFSSGEKYHPTAVEKRIAQHPDVQEALFIGTGRSHAALLLEMTGLFNQNGPSQDQRTHILERIWPTIEEANRICPAYAKITPEHVLFVRPEKPMARSGKGTVQRRTTVQRYEKELDELLVEAPTTA